MSVLASVMRERVCFKKNIFNIKAIPGHILLYRQLIHAIRSSLYCLHLLLNYLLQGLGCQSAQLHGQPNLYNLDNFHCPPATVAYLATFTTIPCLLATISFSFLLNPAICCLLIYYLPEFRCNMSSPKSNKTFITVERSAKIGGSQVG